MAVVRYRTVKLAVTTEDPSSLDSTSHRPRIYRPSLVFQATVVSAVESGNIAFQSSCFAAIGVFSSLAIYPD